MDPIIPQPQGQVPMDSDSASPVLPHKHFLNKKFIVTFVILLLLGGGAYAGIWWWENQNSQVAVPSVTPDPTTDWKTYTNTQYGFEFKYPGYLTAKEFNGVIDNEQSDRGVNLNGSDTNIRIGLSIDNTVYIGGAPTITTASVSETFGQLKVMKSKGYSYQILPQKDWFISYYFKKNNHSFDFTIYKSDNGPSGGNNPIDSNTENMMDQILSTFKFTNSSVGQFCGGIAGVACPNGYNCKLDGNYPDAGGTCVKVGIACTQEAKQCSDGSYVGRTGPNCEFATCPK